MRMWRSRPAGWANLWGSTPGIQTYLHGGILYNPSARMWRTAGTGSAASAVTPGKTFCALGIGVGSSLEDVVALLGCDPAGDPGDNSPWQLYGTPGTMLSATVYPGEEDGRFLSVWTEGGGLQIQFDDTGRAVQISCYVGEDSRYPHPRRIPGHRPRPLAGHDLRRGHGAPGRGRRRQPGGQRTKLPQGLHDVLFQLRLRRHAVPHPVHRAGRAGGRAPGPHRRPFPGGNPAAPGAGSGGSGGSGGHGLRL